MKSYSIKKSIQNRLNEIDGSVSAKASIDPDTRMPDRPLSRNQWMGAKLGLIGAGATGISSLADASDTEIIAPQANQVLTWDHDISKWVAMTVADLISLQPNEYGDTDVAEFLAGLNSAGFQALGGLREAIISIGNPLWQLGEDVETTIRNFLNDLDSTAWEALGSFADSIREIGNGIWETASDVTAAISDWYNTTELEPIVWIRDTITEPVREAINDALVFVEEFLEDPLGKITGLGQKIIEDVLNWAETTNFLPIKIIRTVLTSDAVQNAFQIAVDFFESLGDGIASAIKIAGEFFASPELIPQKILNFLLDTPEKVANFVSGLFVTGSTITARIIREIFGTGITDVNNWLQNQRDDIITALGPAGTWLSGITAVLGGKIIEVTSWFDSAWTGIKTTIDNSLFTLAQHVEWLRETLTDLLTGGGEALSNLGNDVYGFLQTTADAISAQFFGDGSGGGDVSFPLLYGENRLGDIASVNISLDLGSTNAHIHTMRLTGNPTIHFTNLPQSGKRVFFQLEITQDNEGDRRLFFATRQEYTVQALVDIGNRPDTTTIINGYADHNSVFLANFGSRITNIISGGGTFDLRNWATFSANDAINANGNQINGAGALYFNDFAGIRSSLIPRTGGIDVRAGAGKSVRLQSSLFGILAEFREDYIDLRNKELRNVNLSLSTLEDVTARPLTNSVLKYDQVNENWFNGIINISELGDAEMRLPIAPSSILKFDADINKWINARIHEDDLPEIPLSKLADITARQVVVTDLDGKLTHSFVTAEELSRLRGYDTTAESIETRLSSLETGDSGSGFDTLHLTTNFLPVEDKTIQIGATGLRINHGDFWTFRVHSDIILNGKITQTGNLVGFRGREPKLGRSWGIGGQPGNIINEYRQTIPVSSPEGSVHKRQYGFATQGILHVGTGFKRARNLNIRYRILKNVKCHGLNLII